MSAKPFAKVLADRKETILYGAGNVGRDVRHVLSRHGIRIPSVLDRNATPGAQWDGLPLLKPEEGPRDQGLPVIITIFNRGVDVSEVEAKLESLGYGPVISFVDFHASFPGELGDRFWLTDRETYARHEAPIAAAAELFQDETSRTLFDGLMSFRRSGDYRSLPKPRLTEIQYLPSDLPGWPPIRPLRLVDGGAYDGDSLVAFERAGQPIEAAAAFEPDLESFGRLAGGARSQLSTWPFELTLWPCGLGSRTGLLPFRSGLGEASRAGVAGDALVPFVALDDALVNFRPNLIKLDVEGSETEALEGAARLIRRHRPGLAVCVYHRPGHLWEIPLLLSRWDVGYRFHLRLHAFDGFDLVLYAIPV